MSSSHDSKTAPAVLLLDEIEKLLAQTRLLELRFEQARATSEQKISGLEQQAQQLQDIRRVTDEEIATLRHQVTLQERALTVRDEKVHELQMQVAAKQLLAERRVAEIEDLRATVTQLSAEAARQDYGRREPGPESADESGAHPTARRAEITSEGQEFAMNNKDHDEAPAPSAVEIEQSGATQGALEQSLRDEVSRLLQEAQERNQILQDRNDELVRVKSELDRLRERLSQLELSTSRAETALRDDSERMRTEFQAQLALLQAELSQREWALEERQAEARGQEQHLRQEIESLRQQLIERKAVKRHDAGDFVFGEPRDEAALEQNFEDIGQADRGDRYSGSFAQARRWNTGFGWKRRWRS